MQWVPQRSQRGDLKVAFFLFFEVSILRGEFGQTPPGVSIWPVRPECPAANSPVVGISKLFSLFLALRDQNFLSCSAFLCCNEILGFVSHSYEKKSRTKILKVLRNSRKSWKSEKILEILANSRKSYKFVFFKFGYSSYESYLFRQLARIFAQSRVG